MKVRTIKDVDEETWRLLKNLSEKKRMKMGKFLGTMVRGYSRKGGLKLSDIIPKKPILTKKEAEDIKSIVVKIRHEYGFRE